MEVKGLTEQLCPKCGQYIPAGAVECPNCVRIAKAELLKKERLESNANWRGSPV